ncbi:MAG: hypothetical protein WBJ03_05725 [Moraxellaceae bacterium]
MTAPALLAVTLLITGLTTTSNPTDTPAIIKPLMCSAIADARYKKAADYRCSAAAF